MVTLYEHRCVYLQFKKVRFPFLNHFHLLVFHLLFTLGVMIASPHINVQIFQLIIHKIVKMGMTSPKIPRLKYVSSLF